MFWSQLRMELSWKSPAHVMRPLLLRWKAASLVRYTLFIVFIPSPSSHACSSNMSNIWIVPMSRELSNHSIFWKTEWMANLLPSMPKSVQRNGSCLIHFWYWDLKLYQVCTGLSSSNISKNKRILNKSLCFDL